jgi:DNA-binding LytR/AlgR family response regulator
MIKAIIIEDEKPARDQLVRTLVEANSDVHISATLSSVSDGIDYLQNNGDADIIFSDVQLPDGLSFEIFSATGTKIPVIFITGYDEFIMNAFEYNGIDYLLKPVNKEELVKALNKYHTLKKHFSADGNAALTNMMQNIKQKKKSRMVVRKGIENISLTLQDIALFYTENKIVYVIDKTGKKYLSDKNLSELEEELDPDLFFRANRQYIVNINYVKGYKAYEKVKLQVDLTLPEINHCIIISQETAPAFRKWMYDA